MSELQVGRVALSQQHFFEESVGDKWAIFLFPVKGEAQIRSAGCTLRVVPGELAFLPEGVSYRAIWDGAEIEYRFFRIVSRQYDTQNVERFAMQKLALPDRAAANDTVGEIYRLFSGGDRIARVHAIGLYYEFYAQVLPLLQKKEPEQYHPAVVRALSYLDSHFAEDFDMKTLAQEVFISESRLFHLFRKQLCVTPTQYRNEMRVIRASRALHLSDDPIETVAEQNGFHSTAYFRKTFKEITGLSPSEYRQSFRGGNENSRLYR